MKNVLQDHANIHRVFIGRNQNILPQVKNILFVVPLLLASFNYDMAFAFTYQTTVDISFTFNSTATLSISGDLVIENLTPGNSSDSNIITISASSNNIVGYDIKATVGDSTHSYTDLRRDSSDTTNIFASLSSNVSTLNSFSNDTWGYSYSTDDGASWVSGNTGSTNTGYNGLPLYTGTGVKLADTSFADTSTIQFKIGAKAGSNKVSGDYTNVINFQMTSKILTTNYTLNYLPNDGNNGQDVSNMPNPATVSNTITQNTNYTLSSSTPARDGYTFAGWCDGTVTNEACSGATYQPGDTYVIRNTGGSSTINLNAMWETIGIADLTDTTWYLQNPTASEPESIQVYEINFTSNGSQYTIISNDGVQALFGDESGCQNYYDFSCYSSGYQFTKGWGTWVGGSFVPNSLYRTIHITGGADATNTDFIGWLQTHALQANLVTFNLTHAGSNYFGSIEIYEGTRDSIGSSLFSITNLQSSYEVGIPLAINDIYVQFIDNGGGVFGYYSSSGGVIINHPPEGLGATYLELSILGDGLVSGRVDWDF